MEQQAAALAPQYPPPPPLPSAAVATTDAQPYGAGNAAFAPPLPTQYPSFPEMITTAIIWDSVQGKEGGSSKRAIAKYIDRVYNLPPSQASLLTSQLQLLKSTGQLVMVKNSYQLATSVPQPQPNLPPSSTANPTSPKKKPGRPPKPRPDQPEGKNPGQVMKKRPGRPAKQMQHVSEHQIMMAPAEVPFVQPISEARPVSVNGLPPAQKRRPGRPSKQQQQSPPQQQQQVVVPVVPFGEPQELPPVTAVKRRPGRPARNNAGGSGPGTGPRPRGRPKRSGLGLGVVSVAVGKRPRGRPPRQGSVGVGVGNAIVGGASVKRRGRPAKGSGPPKLRRLSGKPLGRPKKDAAGARPTTELAVASEELRRKLDLIQSKVRDTVAVIRPYVANETEALMLLQQLEELVMPNVTAPPTAPPLMAEPMNVIVPPITSVPISVAVPPNLSDPPTEPVAAPVMNASVPFSINLPPMTVASPFQAPTVLGGQQPMSWMPSRETQS